MLQETDSLTLAASVRRADASLKSLEEIGLKAGCQPAPFCDAASLPSARARYSVMGKDDMWLDCACCNDFFAAFDARGSNSDG